MRWVIAYDVACDRRRERVARLLEACGERVQYSVFEAEMRHDELAHLVDALASELAPPADRLRVWRLCGACQRATHAVGGAPIAERDVAWVV